MSTVRQALQSALDKNGGTIPFDAFMAIALHHPQDGYYTRNVRTIGGRGDFTTVPQLTPELGEAIGGWLRHEAERRGWKRFNVIECGPGSGALAATVIKSFGWFGRRKVNLRLVETSAPLRAEQRKCVRGTWHGTIEEALVACEGRALIYHNEFFDAFPCRAFEWREGAWLEIHLRVRGGRLCEELLPQTRPLPASTSLALRCQEGQRIEVFESVRSWMREMSTAWREGAMLCVDYGGAPEEIYHRRPRGTLRAYRGQQRLGGDAVYEMPGRQDITADVNFADLAAWAKELGWGADTGPLTAIAPGAPGAESFRFLALEKN